MVALRLMALLLLVGSMALPAQADVFPYEAVGSSGQNNVLDSNASSCDSVEGCYTTTGTRCSDNPNSLCNLQIVPAGRCSYGNLANGLASCVWPHRAGRCTANIKVGCLTSGANGECSGLTPDTCSMAFDKFGRAADPNDAASCTCTNANATTICGGTLSVCSDGDDTRDVGGNGVALGVELKLGAAGSQTFANMGPAATGSSSPNSTPGYGLENPPVNFDPQRDAGSIGRSPQGTGPIHQARTTDAREIEAYTHPTIANPGPEPLNVRKVTALGDSYWGDWFFVSVAVSGTFNTHIVTYTCDPPVGWTTGTAVNGAGQQCYNAARNGISFLWQDDLTAGQKAAYSIAGVPVCPPHCYKDFNISTTELQEFNETGLQDPNAGIQLAIQSGEVAAARVAGARDTIGVAAVTSLTYLVDNDLRCKMGGWGNAPGVVGRCSDGATACDPDGAAVCGAEGGSCRACYGPFNAGTNPLGLPIGYNTHGYPELDLVAGQRIGGIAGQGADVRVPLFVVGTTGNAASDFRDIASQGAPDVDLADMGPVNPLSSFASGIGAGGTFVNGTTLNIGEPCCGTGAGANVAWDPAALGTVQPGSAGGFGYRYGPGGGDVFVSDWALTYDKGPGPDGIPGCIGDNVNVLNGTDACNQKLGFGPIGSKADPAFATGQDDRAIMLPMGVATIPASSAKFQWRDADASTVAYFGLAQNPPTTNSIAAFTLRDLQVFVPRSADVLVKVSTTQCPLTDDGPVCAPGGPAAPDADGDGVPDSTDNCPSVANPGQEDGAGGLEVTIAGAFSPDGVGDACDNCVRVNNPRQAAGYLTTNPWRTLTGGQIDDDHDGYGNRCDGKFVGLPSQNVGGLDLGQFRTSNGEDRRFDTCGTAGGTRPCAIYDLDEAAIGNFIGGLDLGRLRQVSGTTPGPRCAACTGTGSVPLPCTAGTAGSCSP
jgi:hypothetical protein